jgi:hypothetical protein
MTFTDHPRRIARLAGACYALLIACALFAYLYVRPHVLVAGDLPATAAGFAAHEPLYRTGLAAAVGVVVLNLPLGLGLFELLKAVQPRIAALALLFICVAATLEAVNLTNYVAPLITFTTPEYASAFDPAARQAIVRGAMRMFGYLFSVDLVFFGVFCVLTGWLILRSRFLPAFLGVFMMVAGAIYEFNSFRLFLAWPLPDVPWVTLVAELSLAAWLLVFGVDETKWREHVRTRQH